MDQEDEREFARRRLIQRSADGDRAGSAGTPGRSSLSSQLPAGANGPYTGSIFGGSALPQPVQRKFEASLGADLSGVRVHTGAESAQSARALSARAYAVGQDIHFGAGHYDPSSQAGQHLLAHEVAHTVQQSAAGPSVQHKLEVSEPGDACEVEADRAADAMVTGQRFSISPAAGLQRSIMRTADDETVSPPSEEPRRESAVEATGSDLEPTTGGAGTASDGAAGGAPEMVNTIWTINYDQVHTGNARAARARTADTVLHVTSFGITPDSGAVSPATVFSGYNLQPAGRVTMGSRMHPRGQGGEANAGVSYLRRHSVDFEVVGDRDVLAAHGGRGRLQRDVQRAIDALVASAVDSGLFDDASLTQLLPEGARNDGITVRATSHERLVDTVTAEPLHYPAIHRDGQQMHVSVNVPNAEFVARGGDEHAHDHEETTGTTDSTVTHDGTTTTTETEIEAQFMTSVRTEFETQVNVFAETATEWFFSGRLRDQLTTTLRGEGEASLTAGVNADDIPIAALLTGAGMPELALLAGDSAISASLSAALRLMLGFDVSNEIEAELLGSYRRTHTERLETQIRSALMTQFDTTLSIRIRGVLEVSHSTDHTEGTTGGTRDADHDASEHSSEGHGASQSEPRPVLELTNAVAGPEPRRVPTRIE